MLCNTFSIFKLVNFLFDAITYLLKYFETSSVICQNSMFHVQKKLNLNIVQTLKCLGCELNVEFLTNLHNGQAAMKFLMWKNVSPCQI
jgi:hypothetical protein